MVSKDICYLMHEEITYNKLKRMEKHYIEEEAPCTEMSIGFTEFYQAQSAGFKPEIKLKCRLVNHKDVTYIRYNNFKYKVIRVYLKGDCTEFILSGVIPNEEQ